MRHTRSTMWTVTVALLLTMLTALYAGDGEWSRNGVRTALTNGEIIRFTCTVDSVDTLTSNPFHLGKYDHLYWGTPYDTMTVRNTRSIFADTNGVLIDTTYSAPNYTLFRKDRHPFKVQYQLTSAAGAPKMTAYVQASIDKTNWFNVDTLFSNVTSESITRIDVDLNNEKWPYYRLAVYGVALNRSDAIFDARFFAYQEVY